MNVQLLYAKAERAGDYYKVNGMLIVKNLCYHKLVNVHHNTTHAWKDSPCEYKHSLHDNYEQWEFGITIFAAIGPYTGSKQTLFALKFETLQPYDQFWDDNHGRGYLVGVSGRSSGWELPDIALGNPLMLMEASLNDNRFRGRLAVKNLAYEKNIYLRYTTDDWQTYSETSAGYLYGYNPNDIQVHEGEVWEFDTAIASSVSRVGFAVRYEFDDQVYWDNNLRSDYVVNRNEKIGIV